VAVGCRGSLLPIFPPKPLMLAGGGLGNGWSLVPGRRFSYDGHIEVSPPR